MHPKFFNNLSDTNPALLNQQFHTLITQSTDCIRTKNLNSNTNTTYKYAIKQNIPNGPKKNPTQTTKQKHSQNQQYNQKPPTKTTTN